MPCPKHIILFCAFACLYVRDIRNACDRVTVCPIIMPRGRTLNADSKNFQHAHSQSSYFSRTQSFGWATGHPFAPPGLPQSRVAHRQHTAMRVREAREAQPEELLAAILMLTIRSEVTAATVDVERLHAIGQ